MDNIQIIVVVVAAVVALLVLIIGIISVRRERDIIEERLGSYEQTSLESFMDIEDDESMMGDTKAQTFSERMDDVMQRRGVGAKWRHQLARADIKITPFEFLVVHFLTTIGFAAAAYFVVFSGQIVMAVVAAFVGFFAPRIFVSRATQMRLTAFENQLPDTLSLWVNALRSGYSVLQSMEAISRDAPEPTGTEFKRVVQEVQLGIDMEDSLDHLLTRMESEDLDLVITAVNIQREVGGNLAEILDVIGHTIRERIKLKGEIKVLTAQGRITGYLISGLPIVLALFLYGINPGYMGNLFENRVCGWPLLGIGLAMIGIGSAVIQKIVDIEI
jgi:tight adherence protein B